MIDARDSDRVAFNGDGKFDFQLNRALLDEHRPGAVRSQVVRYPLEHTPTRDTRRLDQQRDVRRPRHQNRSADRSRRHHDRPPTVIVKDLSGEDQF